MTKVALVNDFHNTEITLSIKDNQISIGQVKKAQKALCGIEGCICGNFMGLRGYDNPRVEQNQDGSARILGE